MSWIHEPLLVVAASLPHRTAHELEIAATVLRMDAGNETKIALIERELGKRERAGVARAGCKRERGWV